MHRSASLSLGFTVSLAWRSLICPAPYGAGRAGWVACPSMQSPLACPYGATAKRIDLLGLQPCGLPLPAPPILLAALLFGQMPAHLVCRRCLGALPQTPLGHFRNVPDTKRSPIPPETRKVSGYAPCPSFSRSVSTDYRLLT